MSDSPAEKPVPGPRVLRAIEGFALYLAIGCTLAICLLIVTGVITRAIFNWSLPDLEIFVRDLMVGSVILPLAYVTAERSHIAVDVFVNMLPQRWSKRVDLLGSVVGLLVLLPIVYGAFTVLKSVLEDGAYFYGHFEVPEWPGKSIFLFGYLVFALRLLALVVMDFAALFGPGHERPEYFPEK